jgi:hypothetical protein
LPGVDFVDRMNQFTRDVLVICFSYLRVPDIIYSIPFVNREWYQASKHDIVWRPIVRHYLIPSIIPLASSSPSLSSSFNDFKRMTTPPPPPTTTTTTVDPSSSSATTIPTGTSSSMPRSMREQFRYYRHCASAIPRMDGEHVAHEWPSSVSSTIPFAKPSLPRHLQLIIGGLRILNILIQYHGVHNN